MGRQADGRRGADPFTVHRGDARRFGYLFDRLVDADIKITTTVTSPPYFDLIDYGQQANQIGHGQQYEVYLNDCRSVFKQIYDRTSSSGSLWIIADTFLDQSESPSRLRNLPFDLASQCESIGWILRDVIIWHKDKTRPWSQPGRMRNTFEYILYFVRSADFKYNVDAIREPAELAKWWVKYPERYNPRGRAPDNVWRYAIPSQGSWANSSVRHACPLPPQLIDRIIRLSSDRGDVICDPFAGSGTVVAEAERLGRNGFGIELNPSYVKAFKNSVRPDLLTHAGDPEVDALEKKSDILSIVIKKLRALKFARTTWSSYVKQYTDLPVPSHVIALVAPLTAPARAHLHQDVSLTFVCDGTHAELDEVQRCIKEIAAQPPLTKYGISGDVRVVNFEDLQNDPPLATSPLWLYQHGHTWRTDGLTTLEAFLETPRSNRRMSYPPIASNIEIGLAPEAASGELT